MLTLRWDGHTRGTAVGRFGGVLSTLMVDIGRNYPMGSQVIRADGCGEGVVLGLHLGAPALLP